MTINILVAFLLTPFVIHELGTSAYGFWAVLQSLLSYTFLLDLRRAHPSIVTSQNSMRKEITPRQPALAL